MTFVEFLYEWADYKTDHPDQRYGQSIMNFLHHARPDLYEQLAGTELDCFYLPVTMIDRTMYEIARLW